MSREIKGRWLLVTLTILFSAIIIGVSNIVMSGEDNGMQLIGKNGLIVVLLALLFSYISIFCKDIFTNKKKFILYGTIVLIVLVPSLFLANTDYFLLMPFLVAGMIIAALLDTKLGMMTNLIMVLMIGVISPLSIEYILFFIISGSVGTFLITTAKERQKIFYVALYMIFVNAFLVVLISLVTSRTSFDFDIYVMINAVVNAALSVIITTGSMPLWETVFDVMTSYKLLELTNSNQKLLQRLMIEAPGTYHHSQMVANLAETATADIGGNALLARTGALYHDIGKLKNPEYFTENQNGTNPHDELSPDSSAKIIIAHVSDGVAMAKESNLPKSVVDIIAQHQGDTTVRYFYYQAKEHSDGFEIDEKLFKYAGPKPGSNEAAIVMLADCVEAYVRALNESDRTMTVIDNVIKEIINGKLADNQLEACELKISELTIIAKAFRKVYNGMYHERVKYPKQEL
jgi:putative nucleotidyltransferase with HDIG domain